MIILHSLPSGSRNRRLPFSGMLWFYYTTYSSFCQQKTLQTGGGIFLNFPLDNPTGMCYTINRAHRVDGCSLKWLRNNRPRLRMGGYFLLSCKKLQRSIIALMRTTMLAPADNTPFTISNTVMTKSLPSGSRNRRLPFSGMLFLYYITSFDTCQHAFQIVNLRPSISIYSHNQNIMSQFYPLQNPPHLFFIRRFSL